MSNLPATQTDSPASLPLPSRPFSSLDTYSAIHLAPNSGLTILDTNLTKQMNFSGPPIHEPSLSSSTSSPSVRGTAQKVATSTSSSTSSQTFSSQTDDQKRWVLPKRFLSFLEFYVIPTLQSLSLPLSLSLSLSLALSPISSLGNGIRSLRNRFFVSEVILFSLVQCMEYLPAFQYNNNFRLLSVLLSILVQSVFFIESLQVCCGSRISI